MSRDFFYSLTYGLFLKIFFVYLRRMLILLFLCGLFCVYLLIYSVVQFCLIIISVLESGCLWRFLLNSLSSLDSAKFLFHVFRDSIVLWMCMLVTQLFLTPCNPMDCSPAGSSAHGILQAIILEWVAIHSLLQGIFPTQGLNPGLLHCRYILFLENSMDRGAWQTTVHGIAKSQAWLSA